MARRPAKSATLWTAAVAACLAVATAMTGGPPASAAVRDGGRPPAGVAPERPAPDGTTPLTLLTGDQVLVSDGGKVTTVVPAEGRESVPVQILTRRGHTLVLPLDAQPLIADGTVDERLFDVTELSRKEYRHTGGLPIIVTHDGAPHPSSYAEDAQVRGRLDSINGEALVLKGGGTPALWDALTKPSRSTHVLAAAPGVKSIVLDAVMKASLIDSVPQIGAPKAWAAGYDGKGTTIAVLDTGVSATHPDLAGKVVAAENFSDSPDADDHHGHGTHVASIAASSGTPYTGVAPGARLISGKVLDDSGSGFESDIIEGMQWAVEQSADVINMSLGTHATAAVDPVEEAVDSLSATSDSLFVIAAGNYGPQPGDLGTPGTADAALTVGAVDKSDLLSDGSSVGPRPRDGGVKPDITAPGVDIAAAGAAGAAIWDYGTPVDDTHVALSGTSMATPHVSGAAAILAEVHPDWTGEQLKSALIASALPGKGYTAFQQGTGRVDVEHALAQTVIAQTPSLAFGRFAVGSDETPVSKDLTYRNLGSRDVTLNLSVTGSGPDGGELPDGMFTLDADEVTVPAGGTATVHATADGSRAGDDRGAYGAVFTATGGGQTVRTAGSVVREEEEYELTVKAIDREGNPKVGWVGYVFDQKTGQYGQLISTSADGALTVLVPKGDYTVQATLTTNGETGADTMDAFLQPEVSMTEDTAVVFDARQAKSFGLRGPDDRAETLSTDLGYEMTDKGTGTGWGAQWYTGRLPGGLRTLQLGSVPENVALNSTVTSVSAAGNTEYHLARSQEGALFSGLDERVPKKELARVTTGLGTSVPDQVGFLVTPSPYQSAVLADLPLDLPATRQVYVQAAAGAWSQELLEGRDSTVGVFWASGRDFRAGRTYEETFNTPVFGPRTGVGEGVFRQGDTIYGKGLRVRDGSGHQGNLMSETARTTLYRNGKEYARYDGYLNSARFDVPADGSDYELISTLDRGGEDTRVSTQVTSSYTFTSATASGDEPQLLASASVHFAPQPALDSTSAPGRTVRVPVGVEGQGNAGSLTVWVSTDRGAAWTETPVHNGRISIRNPATGGTVSLRARVTDGSGATLTQTIIDAYRTA